MTASEAIAYIEDYTWSTSRLGLDRTKELLSKLGDPQKKLKFVHVTGSNGKGSTCAMLDSVLRTAGYRTGLYTSPYICEFSERIRVDGVNITDSALASITETVKYIADRMEDHPSQFELVTAIAMVYFLQCGCDIVVLEVGMGGALDSTNVIDAPEVAVITNIGLEHTEYLGKTLTAIATTKAGIIKPGCSCVLYDGEQEVKDVITKVCGELSVPLTVPDFNDIMLIRHSLELQIFAYKDKVYHLPLLGRHQLCNAVVALEVIDALNKRGWNIDSEDAFRGIRRVTWPARFEVLSYEPLFILDGGHNPQCAEALAGILSEYLPGKKLTFIMGVLADKDYLRILEYIEPFARRFICVTPDSPRALKGEELASIVRSHGFEAYSCDNVHEAILLSQKAYGPTIAFGSLYMAGAVLREFR